LANERLTVIAAALSINGSSTIYKVKWHLQSIKKYWNKFDEDNYYWH